jgi:ATP-dependent exoDNAse (exonuclease V) beta subunit
MNVEFHKNLQILANAGSGKTHTLITRILTLLSMGKDPSKIIALTFTRNAAGEFLTKILLRLAAASSSMEEARKLSKDTGHTKSCSDYLGQLKLLLSQLDKLQLTTLDSFFSKVVGAFPQELGLVDQPKLLDPSAEELTGARTLRKALRKLKLKSPTDFQLVADSFLQMDEGSAKRSLTRRLDSFRTDAHGELLEYPEGDFWGNEAKIWPNGSPFRKLTEAELEGCRQTILAEHPVPAFTAEAAKAWRIMTSVVPGTKSNSIIAQIITNLDDWRKGSAELSYRRRYAISPTSQKAAAALVENYLHLSVNYRAREAKAIFRLLEIHEEEYEAEVRAKGVLTFSDITNLLQPSEAFDADRLMIDERLDIQFDHWLLDEFQDTSRSQYRVLANLLQEVISSTEDRSFFCVGDIKQAIYGWRGGDARLFKEILGHYNKHGQLIHDKPLSESWRSSQSVLDALNSTFSSIDTYVGIPKEARRRWKDGWNDHTRSPQAKPLEGYFEWKVVENGEEAGDHIQEEVIALLTGVKEKLAKGMTVALLVRSGDDARTWLDILGAHGILALSQSNPRVGGDNPLAAAVRSAFSLLAHPGDRFALNHLRMNPLGEVPLWWREGAFDLHHFLVQGGEHLSQGGFSSTMEWILETLTGAESGLLAPGDTFSRERASALQRIAIKADESGISDIDDFLQLLSEYEEPGLSAPNAVQVMTIHKSKGLEYDMVVIPFLRSASAIDSLKNEVIDRCNASDPSCNETLLMRLPSQEISKAPGNELLAKAQEGKRAEKAYEELCNWYVAMSRAKRGLYIVSTLPDAKNGKSPDKDCPSITLLLKWSLGEDDRFLGNPDWAQSFQPEVEKQCPVETPPVLALAPRPSPLEKLLPSEHGESGLPGSKAFAERSATALGTAVHKLFESIEWLDAVTPWRVPALASSDSDAEAVELMIPCIASASVQKLLTKPKGATRVWREKRFDIIVEGSGGADGKSHRHWISGCFDRVVIHEDAGGRITGADLIDFKADQCSQDQLVEKHTPQLLSYRGALTRLLGIAEEDIRMILVHVRAEDPVVLLS